MSGTSEVPSSFRSSSVRPGSLALIRTGVTETLSRRRLIAYLVQADLKKSGANTLLGNLWWIVDPLLQMLVYYVLIGVILGRGRLEDYPLFIFTAILPWKWFTASIQGGITSIVSAERLIKQIYFPKLVLPLASSASGVVSFAFGIIPLLGLMLIAYADRISVWLLLIPVVAVVQLVLSLGLAIGLSALNVFYRDIGNIARHALRFWFYLSPSLYGIDEVHRIAGDNRLVLLWFELNPFTHILGAYRDLIYYGRAPDWLALAAVLLASFVVLALAILLFKRVEPTFAKVL